MSSSESILRALPLADLLPGETIYSFVARHAAMWPFSSAAPVHRRLLDERFAHSLTSPVPTALLAVAKQIPSGYRAADRRTLLTEHTAYRYFRAFHPASDPFESASGEAQHHFGLSLVRWASRILPAKAAFCQRCREDDRASHGVAYWHREHQLPGVVRCWRHAVPLVNECASCGFAPQLGIKTLKLPGACYCESPSQNWKTVDHDPLVDIDSLQWLAEESAKLLAREVGPMAELLSKRLKKWLIAAGISSLGGVDRRELGRRILDRCGDTLLNWCDAAIVDTKRNWPSRIGERRGTITIRWLLLVRALFGSVERMEHELRSMPEAVPLKVEKRTASDELITKHRRIVVEYVASNLLASRVEFRKAHPGSYDYLFRLDREWLNANQPERKNALSRPTGTYMLDWSARDREFAERLTATVQAMPAETIPVRLTEGAMLRRTKIRSIFNMNRDRLPLTSALISTSVETANQFYRRRILWALKKIKENKSYFSTDSLRGQSALSVEALFAEADFIFGAAKLLRLSFTGGRSSRLAKARTNYGHTDSAVSSSLSEIAASCPPNLVEHDDMPNSLPRKAGSSANAGQVQISLF